MIQRKKKVNQIEMVTRELRAPTIYTFLVTHHNLVTRYTATYRDTGMQMRRNERFVERLEETYCRGIKLRAKVAGIVTDSVRTSK